MSDSVYDKSCSVNPAPATCGFHLAFLPLWVALLRERLSPFEGLVGDEVYDKELPERLPAPRRIHVTSKHVAGKTLKELHIMGRYRCMIQKIERGHEVIEPMAEIELHMHDVVEVIGQRDAVRAVARELGRFEPGSHATDIAIYAGGIVLA